MINLCQGGCKMITRLTRLLKWCRLGSIAPGDMLVFHVNYLVGSMVTYPSEKYEFVSWDYDIPNIWKNMFQTFPNQLLYNHATSSKFCIFLLTMPQLLGCRPQAAGTCRDGEGVSLHIRLAHPSIGEGLLTHPGIEAIEHKKPWSLRRMSGVLLWCFQDVFRM